MHRHPQVHHHPQAISQRLEPTVGRRPALPARPSVLLVALLAALVPGVAPAVDGLTVSRSGDDLVLTWSAEVPPVDGYRVYKATDDSCTALNIVYDGALTTYTDPGAFLDLSLALYGVAAYLGPVEGPRTGPVYKYPVDLPPWLPDTTGNFLVSLPYHPGPTKSWALCEDINPDPPAPLLVQFLYRMDTRLGVPKQKSCYSSVANYDLPDSEAIQMHLPEYGPGPTVLVWGLGNTPGTITFPWIHVPAPGSPGGQGCDGGIYFVSLPRDHDYADLSSIAAEIPEAVRVTLWDHNSTAYCNPAYVGLSRPSPNDPWSGPNLPLDHPGQGVVIAVASPTDWTPRRRCTAFSFGGGAVGNVSPVASAGGPYNNPLCVGGVIGIWLDATGSFDPDNNVPLAYQWTSSCSGAIVDPTAALSPALFDCNPCSALNCNVTVEVTDALGRSDTASEAVFSRPSQTCVQAGNSLRMSKSPVGLRMRWDLAPAATNYVALGDDRPDQGSPTVLGCGPLRELELSPSAGPLEVFVVDAMDESCAVR